VSTTIVAVSLGLIAILASMSRSLCRSWRDSEALWSHALRVGSGRDAVLETNIGIELYKAGHVGEGMARLRKAVSTDPSEPEARVNLGVALLKQGDESGAIASLAEAVRLAPDRPDFRHWLGQALARRGRLGEALGQLREAVRLRPGDADFHASLGNVLFQLRRRDEAIAEFSRALRIVPGHPGALAGLKALRAADGLRHPPTRGQDDRRE
jgi:Flp pilus assembly protein TadD